ncbi:NAD(P)H nitroreductase [Pararhodospirillum oryzae]|uniref:Putative NAD(P)H nitroreductase n=1 Tax=Pararhodospirillum oryzae TaxID=478448 RepID=A0A512H3L8_9PROT|nr:NAD(P)H nitroreductase [Pararhodospirillum oryzae]GEO80023.1 NAD(P)H nitroreductase [Pararhodospirillum oryzae]
MNALELLLGRRSCHRLVAPAPGGEALALMLRAALRVPDHKRLRPVEFIVVSGEGLDRLGALFATAARGAGKDDATVERARRMPHRAPMLVIVAARPRPDDTVSVLEQQMSAGCSVMALQLAAQAQGFSSVWRSGWLMFDRAVHEGLGLGPGDQIVGFLYVGTAAGPLPPAPSVDPEAFVRYF